MTDMRHTVEEKSSSQVSNLKALHYFN